MKFEEALKLLRNGKRIRPEKADDDQYLVLDFDGQVIDENEDYVAAVTCRALLSDWIVYKENEDKLEDCEDCMTLLGKINEMCGALAEYEVKLRKLESRCDSKKH